MAHTRRNFVHGLGVAGATGFLANTASAQGGAIPRQPLGKTGLQVSALGVGGFHLGSADSDEDANRIVAEALDAGVNFFDNAWEYHDGKAKCV